jgi:ATP-dependent RNA helicase SUPV3L1/SUV3
LILMAVSANAGPQETLETRTMGDATSRNRNVTAVLGPTNTGKTHLAIERMLGHPSGMIGLPLRLLAREVYDKVVARVGVEKAALITGEEKIKPEGARYWVCTVEAMPREVDVDFLAIDEVQLAADPERGHIFTDRLLHARGREETLLLGAGTMHDCIADLIPDANFISRPRLSKLAYSGQKKITRLPARCAIVAFSAGEVYQIAELIRRQQGGAAVVIGALSPRTRNAQVALYQSGDVDYIVATDAIGMGLNLNVDHVALAGTRKFDGQNHRQLTAAELGQIAGRAGRHINDGTFGVTGDVEPLDNELVERLENHLFDPVKVLQWRNRKLDFTSLHNLRESLRELPDHPRLMRARMADDVLALETVAEDKEVTRLVTGPQSVALLWEVCQVPDYRKISSTNHAELVATLFKFLADGDGKISESWFAGQVALADRTDGDIDTLSTRIAHIRTWTFVANRPNWLKDSAGWQLRTRAIEDALSDAMHESLTLRFVDKRTSALMKGMRQKEELAADIATDGAIMVENHFVGRLKGFRFTPETHNEDNNGKASRLAAAQVLAKELSMRARRVASAKNDAFKLNRQAMILWRDEEVAKLEAGDDPLKPQVVLLADEHLQGPDKDKVQERLNTYITSIIAERLKPLIDIAKAEDVTGLARGIAFRLTETFGVLKRESISDEMKSLDQAGRAQLRQYGIRFGAFNIYFPLLLKPAASELRLVLWLLKGAAAHGLDTSKLPEPPRPGLTSVPVDAALPEPFYRAYGFHVCGPRAVRMDIIERLADLIRPLLAWRPPADNPSAIPPKGSSGDGGFLLTPEMMSILGCSTEELGAVLKTLGFAGDKRPVKKRPAQVPTVAPVADVAAVDGASPTAGITPEITFPTPAEPTVEPAVTEVVEPVVAADVVDLAVPDVVAADASVTGDAAANPTDAPAEEVRMEEVWRPRKRGRESYRGPKREGREAASPNEGDVPKRERGPRGRGRGGRGENRPANGVANGAVGDALVAATNADGTPAEGAKPPRNRGNREPRTGYIPRDMKPRENSAPADANGGAPGRDARGPRREGYVARDGAAPGGRPSGPKRDGGGGRDRDGGRDGARDGGRGGDRGGRSGGGGRREESRTPMQVHSSAPPKRSKDAAVLDSPFAKLMALREALEKKT